MPQKTWTKKQLNIFIQEYPTTDDTRKLSSRLNKTYLAIKARAKVLKLKRLVPNSNTGKTTVTKAQDRIIKKKYLSVPSKTLADKLGISDTKLRLRLKQLNLVIPQEIIEQRKKDSQIKPGSISPNKGKKISAEAYEKSKDTMFKKGHVPHNSVGFKDGDIRIRLYHLDRGEKPYKFIRLSKRKWVPLHKHKWENKNGKMPPGHCLWFKDGNTLNCRLSNLELITRAENMHRNSSSVNLADSFIANALCRKKGGAGLYDDELRMEILKNKPLMELKRKQLQLKRAIHEQQKV
ncbi:MAG TPA: HNH endonuclease signature motif containing protein [Chitinophagaceae bacterium]|nr:HNH endonuclease signature motif containing protein [Chitinophagaceae bacterium]